MYFSLTGPAPLLYIPGMVQPAQPAPVAAKSRGFIGTCLLGLVVTLTGCATVPVSPPPQRLPPRLNVEPPRVGTAYQIVVPPFLFETRAQGPREKQAYQAWTLANEFVARTGLRQTHRLPAIGLSRTDKHWRVRFREKDGENEITVVVDTDNHTARLESRPVIRVEVLPPPPPRPVASP